MCTSWSRYDNSVQALTLQFVAEPIYTQLCRLVSQVEQVDGPSLGSSGRQSLEESGGRGSSSLDGVEKSASQA